MARLPPEGKQPANVKTSQQNTRDMRMKVLSIYKTLLRESQKFSSYNFRNYAQRKIRDEFRENKALTDATAVQERFAFAQTSLETIRRQIIVGNLYSTDKLVIEQKQQP